MFYPHDLAPPNPDYSRRQGQVGDHNESSWGYYYNEPLKFPSRDSTFKLVCAAVISGIVAAPYIIYFFH